MLANGGWDLTLILLTWTIWRAPTNASKWRMGFNSAFKGLTRNERKQSLYNVDIQFHVMFTTLVLTLVQSFSKWQSAWKEQNTDT